MASGWDQFPLADAGAQPKGWDAFPLEHGIDFKGPDDQVRKAIAALPEGQRKGAYRMWAKAKVAADKPNRSTAASIGMNLAAGTPIGSFLDEMAGAYSAATGGSYDEGKAKYEARQQAAEDESTSLGTLPLIGEVKTSGVQKVLGGVLSAPLAPVASIVRGTTMLPRIANSMATGAGYGALYGAGEGDTLEERGTNAAIGTAIGGGIGAAAPVVGAAASRGYNAVRNRMSPLPEPVRQYSRGAVDRVATAADADDMQGIITGRREQDQIARAVARGRSPDGLTVERIRRGNPYLGDEGMLLDVGENLRGHAGAIANTPGEGMSRIRGALQERRMDAPSRLNIDLDAALQTDGPGGTQYLTQQSMRQAVTEANQRARPYYEAAYDTQIRVDENLAPLLQRAQSAPGVMQEAQRLMILDGIDPNNPRSNVQFIDYIKRGLDDLASTADPGTNARRLYGNLAREIRDGLDQAVAAAGGVADHPITRQRTSVYAIAREISGEGARLRQAAELGMEAATKGKTADEVRAELQGLSREAAEAYRLGYRTELRRSAMQSNTSFADTGDTAIRKSLNSIDARDKLRMIAPNRPPAGPGQMAPTDRLINRVDAENTFAKSENDVTGNSFTAFRAAGQKLYPPPTDSAKAGREVSQRTLFGTGLELIYRMGNTLMGGALNEQRTRIANDAAQMLIAQGRDRDQIARALIEYMGNKRLSQQQSDNLDNFMRSFLSGTRGPAIESQTGP